MYVASILSAVCGVAVEVYAVWHASSARRDLNYALLGLGIILICCGLVLVTLGAGGPLEG